jgi:antitoxin (DNA-binding transcriptional repressor) of toxin-antitoxin stability system
MVQIPVDEAKDRLVSLLSAAIEGEEIFIITDADELVQLTPVKQKSGQRTFGSAKGMVWMSDDFDEPLDDFAEYM